MPLLLQKLRSGLVELRTNDGLLYARPSLWERLYLLWTFRNFHRLPQQVLNRRQRQLIEKLCRTSVVALKGRIPRTSLIGAVESLDVVLQSKAQTAATGKLVTMAPATPIAKAAGSEKIPISRNRTTVGPTRLTRFRGKSRGNEAQSQSNKRQPSRFLSLIPGNWRTRNWMAAGVALGGGVVLMTMFSYVGKKHVAVPNPAPPVAAAHNPSSPTPLPPRVANPDKIEAPRAIPPPRTATGNTLQPLLRTAPLVSGSDSPFAKTVVPTALLSAAQTNSVQRPYMAESPQNGFSYPIAPTSNLSGRVTLKAVVGIDGRVTSVDVLSGNPLLAKAAVQAVRHWGYAPRKMNGNAVEMETNIVINFLGEDAVSISFLAAESAERPSVGVTQNTERP